MTNFVLLFFLATIADIYFLNYVSALRVERLIGGLTAYPENFKYQVAILGKQNYSDVEKLICGGGIIGNKFVLSAAQCFIDENGDLLEYAFLIATGTIDLSSTMGYRISIEVIYTLEYTNTKVEKDFAVAKLARSLHLKNNPYLKKLQLPNPGEYTGRQTGFVAGYGYTNVQTGINVTTGLEVRIYGDTDLTLEYAAVVVVDDLQCKQQYAEINVQTHMCGYMTKGPTGSKRGICSGDAGTPFVINNVLVGIASVNSIDCDDTSSPCIYTRASTFTETIQIMKHGPLTKEIYVHYNRKHIPVTHLPESSSRPRNSILIEGRIA